MPLSLEHAQKAIAAAHQHAASLGIRIAVAVVDEGGTLQALARMDGAPPLASQIAESKAVGAALWHRDGDALAAVNESRHDFFQAVSRLVRMPMIAGRGSVLIRQGDAILGSVGVSGGAPDQDKECAEAGLASLGS